MLRQPMPLIEREQSAGIGGFEASLGYVTRRAVLFLPGFLPSSDLGKTPREIWAYSRAPNRENPDFFLEAVCHTYPIGIGSCRAVPYT